MPFVTNKELGRRGIDPAVFSVSNLLGFARLPKISLTRMMQESVDIRHTRATQTFNKAREFLISKIPSLVFKREKIGLEVVPYLVESAEPDKVTIGAIATLSDGRVISDDKQAIVLTLKKYFNDAGEQVSRVELMLSCGQGFAYIFCKAGEHSTDFNVHVGREIARYGVVWRDDLNPEPFEHLISGNMRDADTIKKSLGSFGIQLADGQDKELLELKEGAWKKLLAGDRVYAAQSAVNWDGKKVLRLYRVHNSLHEHIDALLSNFSQPNAAEMIFQRTLTREIDWVSSWYDVKTHLMVIKLEESSFNGQRQTPQLTVLRSRFQLPESKA